MNQSLLAALLLCITLSVASACAHVELSAQATAPRGAAEPLVHVVLFELSDATQLEALAADCHRLLEPLVMVSGFSLGSAHDTGRDGVLSDYDLALIVRFADDAAYLAYLEHPAHLELVGAWGPRLKGLRRYDFWDEVAEAR